MKFLIFSSLTALVLVSAASRAEEAQRPNILFVMADDWGAEAGAYGTPWVKTPAFDRVANEGLLFRHAYTPNAKCAPSRAIVLTGRQTWQLEEAGNHLAYFPTKFKSFPEALKEQGYFVGITGKGWGPGIARHADGSSRQLCGREFNDAKEEPPAGDMSSNDYAANFTAFLDAPKQGKPWFFWCGPSEPHRHYEDGAGVAKGGKKLSDIDRVPGYWPDDEIVRSDMLDYAFEVEHVDNHLGRMLSELEQRGELDRTVVIVTGDHGMPFPRVKGHGYLASHHVPLAVRWPAGITKAGRVIEDFVDFTDIAPTVLDLAGIPEDTSGMEPITGSSWRPIFESQKEGRVVAERDHQLLGQERHDAGRPNDVGYPIRSLIMDGFLLIRNYEPSRWPSGNPETGYLNTDGSPTKTLILERRRENPEDPFWALCFGRRPGLEFYDLSKDPDCLVNLAEDPSHQERIQAMEKEMTAKLTAQNDPRMAGKGAIFDKYPIAIKGSRNFYERFIRGEPTPAGWVNKSDFEKKPIE